MRKHHARRIGRLEVLTAICLCLAFTCSTSAIAATFGPVNASLARGIYDTDTTASKVDLRIPAHNAYYQKGRVVVQFPMTTAPAQSLTTNVKFRVWQDCGTGLYSNQNNEAYRCTTQVHPLNQSFSAGVNWATRDGSTPWTTAGGTYGAQVGGNSEWIANCGNWFEWNWANPVPVNGMIIRGSQALLSKIAQETPSWTGS